MTVALGERARQVLSRFPAHLDVERGGKQLGHVVESIGGELETMASQAAGVRNAHRLDFAPTLRDLARLGAIHGINGADLGLTTVRAERLQTLIAGLRAAVAAGGDPLRTSASLLLDAFGVDGKEERLPALTPAARESTPPDERGAGAALLAAAQQHIGFDAILEATRRRISDICELHANGNGTVRAMLLTALSILDLEIDADRNADVLAKLVAADRTSALDLGIHDEFFHSADHFWHSTFVRNSVPLAVEISVAVPPATLRMGDTIALAVLSQRSAVPVSRLIARAIVLGRDVAEPKTRVTFDEADAIADAEGFTVQHVPRGTLELNGAISRSELGRKLGVAEERVMAAVRSLAGAAPASDAPLSPQVAAIVARKYGYRVVLQPLNRVEVLGIEENPLQRERRPAVECVHGQTFTIRRRGFGRQTLRVRIDGVGDGTMGPMFVNRDEGRGVGFFGPVSEGSQLLITEEGRVFLDGADSTSLASSWSGACFADATPHARDFVFDGPGVPARRRTRFVSVVPLGGLDREAVFPHSAESLVMPGINVGETRFAFFVQQAHVGHRSTPPAADITSSPHHTIAFADRSVYATIADPRDPRGPDPNEPVAGRVTLSWLEHEGYAVRLIIPSRFRMLSGDGPSVEERIVHALERIRPAGVEMRVEFADERWTLGAGVMTDDSLDDDPNDLLRGGTTLWSPNDE